MLANIRTALAGRYVLERELGRGATAVVYAARDLKHGRRVALKVINSSILSAPGTDRFLQEIRTTARLNHPHILPLFDSGDADGFIYYTMPLVEGESLRPRIDRSGPMSLEIAVPLVRQVAGALSYAHARGIVHRDVKPENILVGEHEHVWVADFGLARALASAVDQRLTGTAIALGSPHYMSPEQAAGESDADGRSDIYSLGCIAYELLCGEPPFTGGGVTSLLARHLSEPAPSLSERRQDIPADVDAALRRAMSKDRRHRFVDAQDLASALHGARGVRNDPPERSADRGMAQEQVGSSDSLRPDGPIRGRGGGLPAPKRSWVRWFLHEVKSRKVLRVLLLYFAAAAVVTQVINILGPRVGVPNAGTMVILLALAGLPIAAVFAWLYDVVPAPSSPHGSPPGDPNAGDVRDESAASRKQASHPWPAALPTAVTPFVGRDDEVRELHDLLCSSSCRLVTVTGTGGVGKTRLALHTAREVAPMFRDGVVYRALSGLASPDLLVPSLAESLGVPLSRGEDPVAELKAFLREKNLLLVLDNFEHLTSAAGLLATLLENAPGVRMLVTSRERLNLQHETLLALDGLTFGEQDNDSDAVKLFLAGARRLDRHFQMDAANRSQIVRICALLGGIPLAIELASSWVRALSCAEILAELERDLDVLSSESPDLEERHHSMRATFDASWRLLAPPEQSALARLAVFRSAFDRAAAREVADADVPLLRNLVDKSLLTRAGERLLMLDVVRTYALDRLTSDTAMERRARERHLACFTAMLQSVQSEVERADAAAIQRVADSIDDIRAAWNYATQTGNASALARAMDGMFHFYETRGWAREGAEIFAQSRTAMAAASQGHGAARLIRMTAARLDAREGVFLHRLGDLQRAESLLSRGVAATRELEETPELVFALHRLGAVHYSMGDYAEAERLHREVLTLAEKLNDRLAVGWAMTHLGNVAWARGEFDAATRLYTAALDVLREESDYNGIWVTVNNLGVLAASRQQYDEAQRRFREALALQSELKNPRLGAHGLHNLGCAASASGDFERAREWFHEALEISERMGYESIAGITLVDIAELEILENNEAEATAALHRALRTAAAAGNDPLALQAMLTLAQLRVWQGDTHGAAELAGLIAAHPSSDPDVRRKTAELLGEIGTNAPEADLDLGMMIDRIVGSTRGRATDSPPALATPSRITHVQTTEGT